MTKTKVQRRICWPAPDATCLEGGCGYCNDEPFRDLDEIRAYAVEAGRVQNRGHGTKLALTAFNNGESTNWFGRVDVRMVPVTEVTPSDG